MAKKKATSRLSAGLLLYRQAKPGRPEVFLAHPGGPYTARKDVGYWTIPKGMPEPGEELLNTAIREFMEETGLPSPAGPFYPLSSIVQKGGKVVHAWASCGDADPALVCSNTTTIEWPPRSGRQLVIPEVDRCAWYALDVARVQIKDSQIPLIDRLEALLD